MFGTIVLLMGVGAIVGAMGTSPIVPFLVGCLVWGIGLSLGGPTGYAINPARDLGPRIAHQLLPLPGKGPSDWAYSWVPIVGPLIGAALAAVLWVVLDWGPTMNTFFGL
jgi:glycerol uptake facilitator protein